MSSINKEFNAVEKLHASEDLVFITCPDNVYRIIGTSGSGKTTAVKKIALNIMQNHDERVGAIFTEESPAHIARSMVDIYAAQKSCTTDEAFKELGDMATLRAFSLPRINSIDDIFERVTQLLEAGCKHVIIDSLDTFPIIHGKSDDVLAKIKQLFNAHLQEGKVSLLLVNYKSQEKSV